ncbi:MAG: type II secretion system protein [Candidatus Omnitrophica bacterium]|nr:type II secretion system protein [Candidatus Omnitrophota bacterium]
MKEKYFDRRAYSLLEILIVVILMGVVMSIAFSNLSTVIEKQRSKEGEQMLYALVTEQKRSIMEGSLFDPLFIARTAMSENFPNVGTSTGSDTLSSFAGAWRRGSDIVWVWNVEHSIGGGNPGLYVLYIQHGGPAGNNLTIKCTEGPHAVGMCAKLGY